MVRADVGDRIAILMFPQLDDEPGDVYLRRHEIRSDGEFRVDEAPVDSVVGNTAVPSQSLLDPLRRRGAGLEQDLPGAVQESMSLKYVGLPARDIPLEPHLSHPSADDPVP
jgi:hypothetical protein